MTIYEKQRILMPHHAVRKGTTIWIAIHPLIYLPIFWSIYWSNDQFIYLSRLSIYRLIYQSFYLYTYLSVQTTNNLSIYLSICPSGYPSILSVYQTAYLSICPPTYSIHLSTIHPTIYLSVSLSIIYLSSCLLENHAIHFQNWQYQKLSNSARLLHFLNWCCTCHARLF